MAACGFGTSGLRVANLELGSVALAPKLSNVKILNGLRDKKFEQFDGLVCTYRFKNVIVIKCRSLNSEAETEPDSTTNLGDNSEASMLYNTRSTLVPNQVEVEYLLMVLCDTTSIVEFKLKVGEFQLHVTRDLTEKSAPLESPFPAPLTAHSIPATTGSDNSELSPPLALTKPLSSSNGVQTILEKAADEGLKILKSPKVGYFRRSRTIKGKRAPPSCKEKDTVKEGQVLCYIEQLGGELPVESDVSGEVVKILKEDGDPVGYGDTLIAVLPSFPGIMKLQ